MKGMSLWWALEEGEGAMRGIDSGLDDSRVASVSTDSPDGGKPSGSRCAQQKIAATEDVLTEWILKPTMVRVPFYQRASFSLRREPTGYTVTWKVCACLKNIYIQYTMQTYRSSSDRTSRGGALATRRAVHLLQQARDRASCGLPRAKTAQRCPYTEALEWPTLEQKTRGRLHW